MGKTSKRFQDLLKKVEQDKIYNLSEAIDTVKTLASAKFNETVEIALKLNVDPRHADQMVRGSVVLPAGTGKTVRVGADDLVEDIQKGIMNFDVLIATPNLMGLVGKVGRILGPKGLMPNPKTGTVTMDVAQAVNNAKSGQVNFRVDKQGNIHAGLGKVNFTKEQLNENISTFIKAINKHKPATAKGRYVKNASLSLTMSPSIALDTQEVMDLK